MMHIAGLEVVDSGTEYAVIPFDGCLLECDTYAEAVQLSETWDKPILRRRWYVTEWQPLTNLT